MQTNPEITSNADIAPCLAVVIPVFNEAASIEAVVRTVLLQRPVQELIVVDDHSTDGTWDVLRNLAAEDSRVRLFRHDRNQGKGAALRTGFAEATAPLVVVQDADLEYDPREYHLLLKPILQDGAGAVYGSRFLGKAGRRTPFSWHVLGNRLLTALSNALTPVTLTDMETGSKAFRREVIQRIRLRENRFGFEPEITARLSRMNVRIHEVAISYRRRSYADGKKVGWKDVFSALRCILLYNLFRRD